MNTRWVRLGCGLTAVLASLHAAAATNWTQYGFGAAHSSFNSAEKTLKRNNVSSLAQFWGGDLGASPGTAPIVSEGIAYVAAGGSIYAFDIRNGALKWSALTCDGSPAAQLVLSKNRIIAGDDGGDLAGYDAGNGQMKWCRDEGGSIVSAPAVDGDVVYLTNEGDVLAVNTSDGNGRWRYSVTGMPGPSSSPAISGNTVFVTGPGMVYALRKSDGRLLWTRALGDPYELSSPAVSGDTVYVGADRLYALRVSDGRIRWTSMAAGVNVTMPAIVGDRLYVNSQDPLFGLFSLDAHNGALVWRTISPGESSSTVTVANGVVYDITERGELMTFDAGTGALLGTQEDQDGHPFLALPGSQAAVVNGVVYVSTGDPGASNKLDAFKLPQHFDVPADPEVEALVESETAAALEVH